MILLFSAVIILLILSIVYLFVYFEETETYIQHKYYKKRKYPVYTPQECMN